MCDHRNQYSNSQRSEKEIERETKKEIFVPNCNSCNNFRVLAHHQKGIFLKKKKEEKIQQLQLSISLH